MTPDQFISWAFNWGLAIFVVAIFASLFIGPVLELIAEVWDAILDLFRR